jgi:hypothetical protein
MQRIEKVTARNCPQGTQYRFGFETSAKTLSNVICRQNALLPTARVEFLKIACENNPVEFRDHHFGLTSALIENVSTTLSIWEGLQNQPGREASTAFPEDRKRSDRAADAHGTEEARRGST